MKKADGELQPGDLYVAERNTGPHLLTCRAVDAKFGCVYATTPAYPYSIGECVKAQTTTTTTRDSFGREIATETRTRDGNTVVRDRFGREVGTSRRSR